MLTIIKTTIRVNTHLKRSNPTVLSGKIPIKPLEQDRQSSPENATFHKFYSIEYEIELLLQTKFEFIKRQQSSSAAEKYTIV